MSKQQFADRESQALRRYEYPDSYVVAVDLGVSEDAVSVDVLGETAIVVMEGDEGVREAEVDLPATGGAAAVNNGVLTVTVEKERDSDVSEEDL